ncbi:hypothetical protein [Actinomadura sp. 6N118]|uniref:hypothetical protein n=1 Tax=Actinomadura sp. 6N118 TaxID=3375151 RepID=UPI0037A77A60
MARGFFAKVPHEGDSATTSPGDAPDAKTPPLPRSVARDQRLSRRARGFVGELWTHRPGRTFTLREIYEATRDHSAVEGRDALYAAAAEARQAGYIVPVSALEVHGWETRYALNRAAAPAGVAEGAEGFVFVPWEIARSLALSYRARGLLTEQLAEGATLHGVTVAVHRGGIKALARRRPDGAEATTTALNELLAAGHAVRTRVRDDAGRLSWRLTFRTAPPPEPTMTDPADAVDNPATGIRVVNCENTASVQVSPTIGFPEPGFQEHRTTCENTASVQVSPTIGFPGPIGELLQESPRREDPLVVRSVRSAQVADANASHAAPQAAPSHNDDRASSGARHGTEKPSGALRGAEGAPTGPIPSATRSRRSTARSGPRKASQQARAILRELPGELTTGAPGWVRAQMSQRIDALLAEGFAPPAILAAAREIAQGRPLTGPRDHFNALRAIGAALRANRHDPAVCATCGTERFTPGGRCPTCDADRPLDDHELAQLAAARAFLGADPIEALSFTP